MKLAAFLSAALAAAALTTAVAFGAAGGNSGMPVIDVASDGNSIQVSGNLVSGAVDVHITATGNPSGSPVFVRLNPGVTSDQLIAFLHTKKAADPNNVQNYGQIVFDSEGGPGTRDVQTVLQPGDYVAFDGAADNPNNWPHTTFTIDQNRSPYQLPAAPQWQKSVEFKFRGPKVLHTGQVIAASNAGWVVHMLVGIQVKDRATGRKVVKYLRAGNDKAAEKLATGPGFFSLFGPVSHGAIQQFTLDTAPGWYVEACFMDTQDGREHTKLGMARLVQVVK